MCLFRSFNFIKKNHLLFRLGGASSQPSPAEALGAHHAPVRTQLSKGLSFLSISFPREVYSANKFIAYGKIDAEIPGISSEGL